MTRSMWIAIFICAALGLTYFTLRKDHVRVGMRALILPRFEVNFIDRIEIDGTEKVHLFKENNEWQVHLGGVDNKKVAARAEYVSVLFQAAAQIKNAYFATERFDKQVEFQVSDDPFTQIVLYSADKPVWSLLIGDEAPGGGRYVRVPSSLPIFVAKGNFQYLSRSVVDEWRNRVIIPVTKEKLAKVIVKKGGLEKIITGEAVLVHPLTEILINLKAMHFVESAATKSIAQQDLKKPSLQIIIYDKNNSFYELVVANHQKQPRYWVWIRGGNQIYEISPYAYDRLEKGAAAVYDASK